jgi:3-hydroxybutyryl-CoA dehydrogenase
MLSGAEVRRVAIVGAGTMGVDIGALFAAKGFVVHFIVRPSPAAESVTARVARAAEQIGARAKDLNLQVDTELAAVPWPTLALAVESIAEQLEPKSRLFAEMEQHAPAHVPLASNSSGFPISAIGKGLASQRRMLGLHFFMPAHLVPLVEVVCSEHTDPAVAKAAVGLMESVGSVPILVRKDIPGFLANRIQHALMREVWSLIDRGIASADDVDKAVRYGFGMRYLAAGPVLQKEMSGLDVNCAASKAVYPDLCNDPGPPPMLIEKVRRGELGMKTGKGFWSWTPERIAAEKTRYDRALGRALEVLRDEQPRDA